jgi:hypothetical protein
LPLRARHNFSKPPETASRADEIQPDGHRKAPQPLCDHVLIPPTSGIGNASELVLLHSIHLNGTPCLPAASCECQRPFGDKRKTQRPQLNPGCQPTRACANGERRTTTIPAQTLVKIITAVLCSRESNVKSNPSSYEQEHQHCGGPINAARSCE